MSFKTNIFIFLAVPTLPLMALAQDFNFIFEPDSIPVEINGWQPFCPWAGGMGESAPDFCDIDNDGDLDIFVGHFTGEIMYFNNSGDSSITEIKLESSCWYSIECIDGSRSNPDFFDFDSDGDLDMLVGSGHVAFIANTGDINSPDFSSALDTLRDTAGNAVFGTHVSISDIDSDGDGDLICGEYQGHLQFYRNIGTIDSFAFNLEDDNWLNVNVGDDADPCLIDIDADGDYDLFVGEEYGEIWYFRNDGDSANYNFTFVTDNYSGIDAGKYASPEFADIDGDGDYDLFVGRESTGISQYGDVFFYENIGTPENAQFEYVTSNYLVFDISYNSCKIQMVDINGDDAIDLLIGAGSDLHYFQNNGSSAEPSFTFIDDEFQDIHEFDIKPCFVDLDADGDYDLLAGEGIFPPEQPQVGLYINHGTPENPDLQLTDPNYITNDDFFVNTFPGVADIDADGDYDLFITEGDGGFYFYRNDGTANNPEFNLNSTQWITYNFQSWRPFFFVDIDADDDLDLLMTSEDQTNIVLYRNVGTQYTAIMVLDTEEFLPVNEVIWAVPYLLDIDFDNDLDLFCGDLNGGIKFFRNHADSTVVVNQGKKSPYTFTLHPNYPNPFNAQTVIPFTLDFSGRVKIDIFDITGRSVGVQYIEPLLQAGMHEFVWNAEGMASGVYLVRLRVEGNMPASESRHSMMLPHSETRKVVLVK